MDENANPTGQNGAEPTEDPIASPLPQQDNPVSLPDDTKKDETTGDDAHPESSTNLPVEEQADESVSGAAEASEPNQQDAVEGFNQPAPDSNAPEPPTNP